MQSVAFSLPVLADQTEAVRFALASCWRGPRREAFADARRRAGIVREAVWIQPAAVGDVGVVYVEADDLAAAFAMLETSTEPFDCWFRDHVHHVPGGTFEAFFGATELALDFDINRI